MSVITKIEQQKENHERVNIYIDEAFALAADMMLIYKLGLKKGQLIEKEKLEYLIEEEMVSRAKNTALHLLSYTGRTEKEMRDRLQKKDFEETVIDRVISFLMEHRFIDDEALAKRLTKNKADVKKYGQNRIKQDLYNKGFHKDVIESSIDEINEEDEFHRAMELAQKKKDSLKDTDKRKVYEKIGRFLVYRGYTYETVQKVLDRIVR
ncbi:MAG: recombination regulator RecX [Bacillota bacterium]